MKEETREKEGMKKVRRIVKAEAGLKRGGETQSRICYSETI